MESFALNPVMETIKTDEAGKPVLNKGLPEKEEKKLGEFIFRRRTLRDEFKIGAEYSRLTEGIDTPSRGLSYISEATANIKVLLVAGPDGWDLEKLDPLDQDTFTEITTIYKALQEREIFFRGERKRHS